MTWLNNFSVNNSLQNKKKGKKIKILNDYDSQ